MDRKKFVLSENFISKYKRKKQKFYVDFISGWNEVFWKKIWNHQPNNIKLSHQIKQ